MVVVGTDVHKRTHTFVAVDEVGRVLGEKVAAATTAAWQGVDVGARAVRYRTVVGYRRLPQPLGTIGARSAVRGAESGAGGTEADGPVPGFGADPGQVRPDRRVVGGAGGAARARAAGRLPRRNLAGSSSCSSTVAKTLSDNGRRRFAGCWNASTSSTPSTPPKGGSLHRASTRAALATWLDTQPGLLAEIARDELADINRLTQAIDTLAVRIGERIRRLTPTLLDLPGCGELTAAKLVAETAGVSRFKSEAAFARHAGAAPIPVWSGNTAGRVRMSRSGNRQLNAALHRIAITQIRLTDSPGHRYYRKRLAAGNTTKEALRCLKRRLARVVYQRLHTDTQTQPQTTQPAAA